MNCIRIYSVKTFSHTQAIMIIPYTQSKCMHTKNHNSITQNWHAHNTTECSHRKHSVDIHPWSMERESRDRE